MFVVGTDGNNVYFLGMGRAGGMGVKTCENKLGHGDHTLEGETVRINPPSLCFFAVLHSCHHVLL